MANVNLPEVKVSPGPVAWCNRCSRSHKRRECNLEEVQRVSRERLNKDGSVRRGGNKVTRLAHPKPKSTTKKSKARRS